MPYPDRQGARLRYQEAAAILTSRGVPTIGNIGDYAYSNIGYTILGAIVDWVTTQPGFTDGLAGYERFAWSLFANADDAALTTCLDHPWRDHRDLGPGPVGH